MWVSFNENQAGPSDVRFRCACGIERTMAEQHCPACGKMVPQAVSIDGGPWVSYHQFKIDQLRRMLESGGLNSVPDPHRKALTDQIRRLEDGSWATKARGYVDMLLRLQETAAAEKAAEEQEDWKNDIPAMIQLVREELEAAGESLDPINARRDSMNDSEGGSE